METISTRSSFPLEPALPAKNARAILVLAPPCSGADLLQMMLGGHPQLFAPPELELLSFATLEERGRALAGRDGSRPEGLIGAVMEARGCTADEAREIVTAREREGMTTLGFYGLLREWLGDRILVDKTPSYALELEILERAETGFEAPVYIHLLRHPYGMIRSFEEARLDQIFFRHEHSFTRRELAELIWVVSHQNILEILSRVPAERQHQVRFEDLVRHPQRVVRGLCSALGLDFHPDMVRPYKRDSRRMAGGPLPESRMLDDVKLHQHADIDPAVADRWRREIEEDFLGDVTWELAASLGYERTRSTWSRIEPAERVPGQPLPLSFAQQRLWLIDRLRPGDPSYNIPAAVRLQGRLAAPALAAALAELVRRHEALRTTFGEVAGEPVQLVAPAAPPVLPWVELGALPAAEREREAMRLAQREAWRPFDLACGPLLRATLVALGPADHALLLIMHHIVSDGWSTGILVRELSTLYAAFAAGKPSPLPELPVQYGDYTVWQHHRFAGGVLDADLAWWRETLRGLPPALELPADRPRPAEPSGAGDTRGFRVPAEQAEAIQALARRQGLTLFTALLAAFSALLQRYTGQDDVAVGSPVANRDRPEIEGLIGFFVNTLVLRLDLAGEPSFLQQLARTHEVLRGAFAHQELPFERLVKELQPARSLSRTPLFQVMFMVESARNETAGSPDLRLSSLDVKGTTAKLDLMLSLVERRDGLYGIWEVSRDLFDPATVQRMTGHFGMLLAGIVEDPGARLSTLPLLTPAERHQTVVEWNATAAPCPGDARLHRWIEARAARAPDAVAVVCEGHCLTYSALDSRASRAARRLRQLGIGPDVPVAICMERSPEMVVALLAALKAGGAYTPLDPHFPRQRLSLILGEVLAGTGPRVLIAQRELLDHVFEDGEAGAAAGITVLCLDEGAAELAAGDATPLAEAPETACLAYVIFTSGSSGTPKGVGVPHAALAHHAWAVTRHYGLEARDRVLQFASLGFDVAAEEIFPTLAAGGAVVMLPDPRSLAVEGLLDRIERDQLTLLNLPSSWWSAWTESLAAEEREIPACLRLVVAGSERVAPETLALWRRSMAARGAAVEWANAYGLTEATVTSTLFRPAAQEGNGALSVPIGRPIDHVRVQIVDPHGQPVPVGVPGELLLGGPGLARGYLGRPDLTARSFVPDPCAEDPRGGILLRTGDLARWRSDGQIEHLGRIDLQVKVRGFRIEPGEIEAALAALPGVASAVVLAREDGQDDYLVGYVVAQPGETVTQESLRRALRARLPEHMVPARFVFLDELPLTPSGKVDRKALPAPDLRGTAEAGRLPRTPAEEVVAEIWAALLGQEQIGPDDDFFALGGHSLLATRVMSRLRSVFGVELPLRDLFEQPTVAGLAGRVEAALREGAGAAVPPIRPAARTGALPLSFAQQRLWFIQRLAPESAAYNMAMAVTLTGALDRPALAAALSEIVRRHEVLRTTFALAEEGPFQVVGPAVPLPLPLADLTTLPEERRRRELLRLASDEALRPFDLERGPVLRALLAAEAGERHALLLTLHHVAGDGWSQSVLVRELTALYRAFTEGTPPQLAELEIQYADFAVWQRGWLAGEVLQAEIRWWRERLGGEDAVRAGALELPLDRPRPAVQTFRGGSQRLVLPRPLSQQLESFSLQHGATIFMVLLAGFQALLSRYTGRMDVRVGTPIAGRNWLETEGLIGFFVNTLVLQTGLAGAPGFAELVQRVREVTLGAYNHQDLPFEKLVEELQPARDLALSPLFQVMFELHNTPVSAVEVPRLRLEPLATGSGTAMFDLNLSFVPSGGYLRLQLQYDRVLFDGATIQRLAGHLQRLLAAAAADPHRPYTELPLLSEGERGQVLSEWGEGRCAPIEPDLCLPELLARQARRTPEAVAAACGSERLRYAELDRLASCLARRLAARGIGPESVVALLAERGLPLLAAVAGVLRAGAAWLPLDPRHPEARQLAVLSRAGVVAVLAHRDLAGDLSRALSALRGAPPVLDMEEMLAPGDRERAVPDRAAPENLAYVIFTSGSTGVPKGAMVEHRGMLNHLRAKVEDLGLTAADVVAQTASQCFDISVWQMLAPLLVGGRVEIAPDAVAHDPERLPAFVQDAGVTVLELVPSVLRGVLEAELSEAPGLRRLVVTGEACPPELCRRWLERYPVVPVVNAYGPTECSDRVTHHLLRQAPPAEAVRLPIGRPLVNLRLRVLDRFGMAQPCGVAGELAVGGVGVGRGYLGDPGHTAEVFVPEGECGEPGARLYRTGDLARWLTDGRLEFLGRLDGQVKVRGFRIEPGEVEAVLSSHPGVREAAVTAPATRGGERRLVAHVVAPETELEELRRFLRERLPEHMVPTAWVRSQALPRTANGKLNRKALAALLEEGEELEGTGSYEAPRTPVEEVLAEIWSHLLEAERVGVEDDFFALGGHSLMAARVVSRVREAFGIEIPLRSLFEVPTVRGLARRIETAKRSGKAAELPPIRPVPRDRPLPLSFAQQRLWILDRLEPGRPTYNMPVAARLQGALDAAVLEASLGEVAVRHESLRTTFPLAGGQPVQHIAPPRPFRLPRVDLEGLPADRGEAEALRLAGEEARRPFDLAQGPLLRAALLRRSREEHVLLLNTHHIISDGWSFEVMVRELGALYPAFSERRPSPLPLLPIQYADFAARQREWLSGDVLVSLVAHWRERLSGTPLVLELPADRPHPPAPSGRGGRRTVAVPAGRLAAVAALARREGVTLHMALLAVFDTLLHRCTGRDDFLVGTAVANRNRTETEDLIGLFVNQIVLRADLSGDPPFRRLLARVREVALDAYSHQDLPFDLLVQELQPERDLSRTPVFQVVFVLQNVPEGSIALPGLTLRPLQAADGTAKFDLTIEAIETTSGLMVSAEYSTDLFDPSTVARLLGHFDVLLEAAAATPAARLSRLPLLREVERQQLIHEWNDSGTVFLGPDGGASFPRLFATIAAARPGAVAALSGGERLTYGELDRRADRLALALAAEGIGTDAVVALLADRGLEFLTAVLGIFKAGAAYLPLDPRHPRRRLAQLVSGSGACLALVGRRFVSVLAEALEDLATASQPPLWVLEEVLAEEGPAAAPLPPPEPGDLAYVIYTSGSTGAPKGAMVEHGGMLNHLWAKVSALGLTEADVVAQTASQSFDISVWQLLAALLAVGRVEIIPDEIAHDPARLFAEVEGRGVTVLETVPSLLRLALEELEAQGDSRPSLSRLRWLIPTGEALPPELCRRWLELYPAVPLLNAYGPTECSDDVTHHPIRPGGEPAQAPTPIGRPVQNLRLYVLDRGMEPLPAGVPGELFVGGAGVGRGYLRDGGRTAQSFLPDPFAGEAGARLYRTGDLARFRVGGTIEFLGRIDHQVKIRGHRIELGEIETVLSEHPSLAAAAVLVREDAPGEPRLAAYVVPRSEAASGRDSDRVSQWESVYDEVYREGTRSREDSGVNLRVWMSSYTGEPLPEPDIRECVEDSVERILALRPRNLLEIGCGTGLLLLRIAPHCTAYCGADVSEEVLRTLSAHLAGRSGLPPVELLHRAADDYSGLAGRGFDTVVVNEVAHYFPSAEYLVRVLEGAVEATAPGGSIFLGGLRSFPLFEAFHASVALHQAAPGLGLAELREKVRRRMAREKELLVDPGLFTALAARLPRISGVTVQLKGGRCHNELTRFRYDVVLGVETEAAASPDGERSVAWGEVRTFDRLRRVLEQDGGEPLWVRGVPNARLRDEIAALDLSRDTGLETVGELREAVGRLSGEPTVEPEDLWGLGRELGLGAEVVWSPLGAGLLDARFAPGGPHPRPPAAGATAGPASWSRFANIPLLGALGEELVPHLREFLAERLPDAMVPAAWVVLQTLPLTPNGKLDRGALPAPEQAAAGEPDDAGDPAVLRTPTEELLAGIWSDLLGVERVSSGDDFFALGGHSLLATRVVSRIREAFGVEIPLRALFEPPTLAGLARTVEAAKRAGAGGAAPPIVPVPRDTPLPLSFAQQRLWFLDRMVPDNPFYNIYTPVSLSGALDIEVLRRSVHEIVRRHEALRTSFAWLNDQPVQVIHPEVSLVIPLVDLQALDDGPRRREVARLSREEESRPFDLSRSPMLRLQVVRTAPGSHTLLINVHHIASDGWSVRVLVDELIVLYEAFSRREPSPLPELPVQYADFAAWQRQWLQGEVFQRQLGYWKSRLEGISSLELPSDRSRPAVESFRGGSEMFLLRAPLVRELRAMARRHRATLFMVLLSGYKSLLSRYSRQEDVAIGTGIANRTRQEVEEMIGFFVNTLVLRTDLSGLPRFEELLLRVRQTTMESYDFQDLPFEMLVEELRPERSLNRNPLVQVMLAFQNFPRPTKGLRGLSVAGPQGQSGDTGTAKFDLSLFVSEQGEELFLEMEYSTDLFERVTIRRMLAHLERLLRSTVERPDLPAAELPLLTEAEWTQVVLEWSDTDVQCPQEPMVHELVSQHALCRPQALAVSGGSGAGGRLTYGELEARSNRLAHHLRRLGIGPESRVAVCMERTLERVVGIVAVVKAGGAYVSLDPAYPKERLAWLLEDAAAPVLLTQASLAERLPETRALVLRLDEDWDSVTGDEGAPPRSGVAPENLAYVVYTSGSTGKPKGVEIPHAGLMNLVRWHQRLYGVEPSDRGTQVASPAFDASIWELWPYLSGGASLHIPDEETRLSPAGMVRWWDEAGITLAYLPTPLAEGVLAEAVPESVQVRALIIGGDRLHRRPRPDVGFRLMNHYGPAEYSVTSTVVEVAPGGDGEPLLPTIGRALDNTQLYVLDPWQQPMPVGVPGELYVAGVGLARGYSGRPDLTAEKFVPDPFGEAGSRMYRTGDLVKWLPDGDLDFLGRLDFQVKLRGLRIELGEIETVLAQHPAVLEGAVLVREDRPGDKRLVAYVVHDPNHQDGGTEVREEHVAQWGDFFDGVYRKDPTEADPTFNIIGWDSTYSGLPLPAEEMREWLTDTVDRILALEPRRVLEIGCGTGMLLFRLAGRCESYWGTDVSREAVEYVEAQVARQPEKLPQVHLEQRPADRFDGFAPGSFDTVVMNSVVQYFPSVDYLVEVLTRAVEAVRPGGAIFLGDLRSLPLQKVFHTGIELFQADPALPVGELRRRVQARALSDAELQVAPSLFHALQRELPRITRVEVYPRRGRAHNELTQFRYQVVLRVAGEVAPPEPIPWLDWEPAGLSLEALGRRLREEQPGLLGLRNVPNRRVAELAAAARLLFAGEETATAIDLRESAAAATGVEPQDVWDLALELPYEVELGWASPRDEGRFDVVLRRRDLGGSGATDLAAWLPGPELPPVRPAWSAYANRPLQGRFVRQVVPALRAWLGERLPAYMVPTAYVLMDRLPLTPNGKVDRRALPAPEVSSDEELVAPRSPVEEALARIWAELLGLDRVGVKDDFFALGGHSLLANRLVARVRSELAVEMPLRAVFEAPTVEGLARLVLDLQVQTQDEEDLEDLLAELEGLSDEEAEVWLSESEAGREAR